MEKNGKGVFQQENTRLSGWTCPSCILCVKMGLGCCFRQAFGIRDRSGLCGARRHHESHAIGHGSVSRLSLKRSISLTVSVETPPSTNGSHRQAAPKAFRPESARGIPEPLASSLQPLAKGTSAKEAERTFKEGRRILKARHHNPRVFGVTTVT